MNKSQRSHGTRQGMALCRALCLILAVACPMAARAAEGASCRVLDPELQGSYTGACVNGLAEGIGQAAGQARYEGAFQQGRKHGKGVKVWPSGDRYEGDFVEDRKERRGTYARGVETPWAGEKYSGAFRNDRRDGMGTYEWPDGERYSGRWELDAVVGPPTGRMLAQAREQRERLSAVSKPGITVCRQMRVGSVVQDWLRGTVMTVARDELTVRITNPGNFEHRIRGVIAAVDVEVRDWALMWTPCR